MIEFMRKPAAMAAIAFLLATPAAAATKAADDELKQQVEALKKGQEDIQKQLAEIKTLIQARPAAAAAAPARPTVNVKDVSFSLGPNPIRGKDSAKLTLIEFSDYQCPYCANYARDTYPQIAKEYIDTGKLRYVMHDLPLDMHQNAFKAAEAVRCAGDQGKFWEMHERLFTNQRTLAPWRPHAEAIGIDADKFDACLNDGKYTAAIKADQTAATSIGITGTPGFVLAVSDPKDPRKATGITYLAGAHPFASFKTEIDKALAGP